MGLCKKDKLFVETSIKELFSKLQKFDAVIEDEHRKDCLYSYIIKCKVDGGENDIVMIGPRLYKIIDKFQGLTIFGKRRLTQDGVENLQYQIKTIEQDFYSRYNRAMLTAKFEKAFNNHPSVSCFNFDNYHHAGFKSGFGDGTTAFVSTATVTPTTFAIYLNILRDEGVTDLSAYEKYVLNEFIDATSDSSKVNDTEPEIFILGYTRWRYEEWLQNGLFTLEHMPNIRKETDNLIDRIKKGIDEKCTTNNRPAE